MKASKRDLLVLSQKMSLDEKELEKQVERLHALLFHVESISNFCRVTEVININNYTISQKPAIIEGLIKQKKMKPFIFLSNNN